MIWTASRLPPLWMALAALPGCGPSSVSTTASHDEADLLVELDDVLHLGWSRAARIEALDGTAPGHDAAWSPGGDRIARVGVENTDIRVFEVDTLNEVVVAEVEDASHLAWSPGGHSIAFREYTGSTESGESEWELAVVDVDRGGQHLLSETFDQTEWSPLWSPNGEWIAVSADQLRLYRPVGGEGPSFPLVYIDATWSSDSSRLLVSNNDGLFEVDVVNGSIEKLAEFSRFAWSEVRGEIASRICSSRDNGKLACDLITIPDRGGEPEVIASSPDAAAYIPIEWSLDGEQLLVLMTWWHGPGYEDTERRPNELWVMNGDGSSPRRLARGADSGTPLWARWRPAQNN